MENILSITKKYWKYLLDIGQLKYATVSEIIEYYDDLVYILLDQAHNGINGYLDLLQEEINNGDETAKEIYNDIIEVIK